MLENLIFFPPSIDLQIITDKLIGHTSFIQNFKLVLQTVELDVNLYVTYESKQPSFSHQNTLSQRIHFTFKTT